MSLRPCLCHLLPSMITVCVFLPGTGLAQVPSQLPNDVPPITGPGTYGTYKHGKVIPLPPPNWSYYGVEGGPELTASYPFVGWPGYRGSFGSFFTNGPRLSQTAVPVYTQVPTYYSKDRHGNPTERIKRLGLGIGTYGWFGTYTAFAGTNMASVQVWAPVDARAFTKHNQSRVTTGVVMGSPTVGSPVATAPTAAEACVTVTVKLPNPTAEVYVEGVKTAQTGTDRVFESPPIQAGSEVRYELVARWTEGGVTVERKRVATGQPGGTVAVDFTTPDVLPAGR